MECRQRLAGYTYILGHDMDEVIVPMKGMSIKQLIQEQFQVS